MFTMAKLAIAATQLQNQYQRYELYYKNSCSSNTSRNERDNKFKKLLTLFDSNDSSKVLYDICKFYDANKNSGFLRTTPTLINFIRQALYVIFNVEHLQLNNRKISYGAMLPPDPTPETDVSIKILENKIKEFYLLFENDRSSEIQMSHYEEKIHQQI